MNIDKMAKAINFKSKGAYKKWIGYGWATGVFKDTPGHQKIKIRGKKHKVQHGKKKKNK